MMPGSARAAAQASKLGPLRRFKQLRCPTVHYGGFWIRVVSALMDTLLLFTAVIPVRMFMGSAIVLFGVNAGLPSHETMVARRVIRIAIGIALGFAYTAGMESSAYQATLGKLAVRLKVTDQEGRRLSFARATARYFSKMLSAFALGLGYLMVRIRSAKTRLARSHCRDAGNVSYLGKFLDSVSNFYHR